MNKRPLYVYVIAVAVVWAFILGLAWFAVIPTAFTQLAVLCAGFALGMLAMYIAVHLYTWH